MEELQEKSLNRETVSIELSAKPVPFEELDPPVRLAIECAAEKKAFGIAALDLREIASFTEFFVIASTANQRQAQAVADEIADKLRSQLGTRPIRTEGYSAAEWILLDYGDFVFHVFNGEAREFYDLERLWRDARKVALPESI